MESQQKAGDSHFSNGHTLVWAFCVVRKKNLAGNFTGLWRLQLSQSGQMSSRCGLQKIAHWSSKGSPLLLNRHCQIVQRENAFIFLRLSHLHRVLDFPTDVLDEEQTCTWQTDLYGQFRPGLNNLFGFWFDVEVSSQDTIALCNIHQALAWCWPGSADMTQQISSI